MLKHLILTASLFFLNNTVSSKQPIELKLNLITVASGYNDSLSCSPNREYYIPVVIAFQFEINNLSDKQYISFGSNTLDFYRNHLENVDRTIGRFYLINNNDTIALFTRDWNPVPSKSKQNTFTASLDFYESFGNQIIEKFLCKFVTKEEKESHKLIIEYLKTSKIIYVPVIEDYNFIIKQEWSNIKNDIIYPEKVIEVQFTSPLYISFGKTDDDDNYQQSAYQIN